MESTITISQDIRQRLAMTAQMQQAVELLRFDAHELEAFVSEMVMKNPLLEHTPGTENEHNRDIEYPCFKGGLNTGADRDLPSGRAASAYITDIPAQENLTLVLERQVYMHFSCIYDQNTAFALIGYLSPSGFLDADPVHIAQETGIKEADVARVLKTLKTFEPTGIFSSCLGEYYIAALEEQEKLTPQTHMFLNNLQILGDEGVSGMSRRTGISPALCRDIVALLRKLNTCPAAGYASSPGEGAGIRPDLVMELSQDVWTVSINPDTVPRVFLNSAYYTHLERTLFRPEDCRFLEEAKTQANWLLRALEKRFGTLLGLGRAIINRQQDFFTYGIRALKPLNLSEVAQEMNVHASTVSRLASHKYLQSPQGIYPLKFFFSHSPNPQKNYESISAASVKDIIRIMVREENRSMPMSDEDLMHGLERQGIRISRRTVAKYRASLRIPNADRRRFL